MTLHAARLSIPSYPLLTLKPFSLAGGGSYVFSLSVTDHATGATGSAQAKVSINLPPSAGTLRVSPAVGAFGDAFTITASDFLDDDLPLQYYFSSLEVDTDCY